MAKVIEEYVKDPGSAITHFIGMLMAIFAAIPLLIKAAQDLSCIHCSLCGKSDPALCSQHDIPYI